MVVILPLHLNIIHKEYNCTSVNMKTSAHARQDTICAELASINLSSMTCKYKGNEYYYCSEFPHVDYVAMTSSSKKGGTGIAFPGDGALFLYHVNEVGA